jgi:hypothetical protein
MKYLCSILFALVVLTAAQAQNCSNATLKGAYGFSIHGETIGFFVGTTLTRFASPTLVDGVAREVFDGAGHITAVDFIMRNGASVIGPTTPVTSNGFRSGETGTYSVSSDCTGDITLHPPDGAEINQKIVVDDSGDEIRAVFSRQHVLQIPGIAACVAPDGCDLAVNVQATGQRGRRDE